MEKLIVVDQTGLYRQVKLQNNLAAGDIVAVELVLMFIPAKKRLILLNRSTNASDMHNYWALESGKVRYEDLTEEDKIGHNLSDQTYINAAVRELKEELNFSVNSSRLRKIDQFHMPYKKLFFSLLSLPLDIQEVNLLLPDQYEIDRVREFSLDEFEQNVHLGDAICYRKDQIISFLRQQFREDELVGENEFE